MYVYISMACIIMYCSKYGSFVSSKRVNERIILHYYKLSRRKSSFHANFRFNCLYGLPGLTKLYACVLDRKKTQNSRSKTATVIELRFFMKKMKITWRGYDVLNVVPLCIHSVVRHGSTQLHCSTSSGSSTGWVVPPLVNVSRQLAPTCAWRETTGVHAGERSFKSINNVDQA